MKLLKYALVAIGLVAALVLGAKLAGGPSDQTAPVIFGAAAGTDHTNHERFLAGITDGGPVYATATVVSAETLSASVLEKNKVLRYTASSTAPNGTVAAITVTLPASSTMSSVLKYPGDTRSWVIENGYTAAATTTSIAAGAGIDLQIPETTGADAVININGYGFLTCFREVSTDIVCRLDETVVGD